MLEADAEFGPASWDSLKARQAAGLLLSPISFVELAPAFSGDLARQQQFLQFAGIRFDAGWQPEDTFAAHPAWHRYVVRRRGGHSAKRPLADILIGAFASRHQGLLTRNPANFARDFPRLRVVVP